MREETDREEEEEETTGLKNSCFLLPNDTR
jgi:hypothetical protein